MRRNFIGGIHSLASKPETHAARRDEQVDASNDVMALTPSAPFSSASRNAAGVVPSGETSPIPLIATLRDTGRYVTIITMPAQRVAALLVTCLMAGTVAALATVPDLFDEIYARGKPLEATLKTLTARFTETSHSPLLAQPLVARGTIAVIRPARVVMHYTAPESRTVIIDGGKLRLVWPSRAIDRTTPIGAMEKRIQQFFVDSSPKQLRSHFDIAARLATDRPNAWFVTMKPKRKQIREGLSQIALWIEQDRVMLSAMQMIFQSGDTKLLEFDDVRINPAIDESAFSPRKE